MTIKVRRSGAYVNAPIKVRRSGAWVSAPVYVRRSGVWVRVDVVLTAAASPSGGIAESTTLSSHATSASASVSVSGNAGTISYNWFWVAGGSGMSITTPTSITTKISASGLVADEARNGQLACTVTDSGSGQSVTTNAITVSISRSS